MEEMIIVGSFVGVTLIISFVIVWFLGMARRLEKDYIDKLEAQDLVGAMEKETIFDRMVRGGRVLQYITILGAFSAVFFLAILKIISGELAGTIIGMIITGVIGAEAGARSPGELKKEKVSTS